MHIDYPTIEFSDGIIINMGPTIFGNMDALNLHLAHLLNKILGSTYYNT